MSGYRAKPPKGSLLQHGHRLASGLVAAYQFNEGGGLIAYDSASKNTGTLTNGPAWSSSPFGKCLSFDGSDDHIALASFVRPSDPRPVSVSLWLKTVDTTKAKQSVFCGDSTDNPYLYLGVHNVGGNDYQLVTYSGGYDTSCPSFTQDTNWHQYGWTWAADGTVKYYRDGSLLGSGSLGVGGNRVSLPNIGAIIALAGAGFTTQGLIDHVFVYSVVLPASIIRQLASDPFAMFRARRLPVPVKPSSGNRRRRVLIGSGTK